MLIVGVSFVASLCLIVLIGALAAKKASATSEDYLLAGRSLPPWLAAFSSAATNNSGYMFIGLIGYAYTNGLEAVWLQSGWVLGDILAWLFIHRAARESTAAVDALSVSSWLGTTPRKKVLRGTVAGSALVTFVFLAGYAAAQFKAGSASLEVMFGWDPLWGILLSAAIVVIYCFSGGFRASVWTDAAQSFVMFFAIVVLLFAAFWEIGGWSELLQELRSQDPSLVSWFPTRGAWGVGLFFIGYIAGGSMAVAQPHILTRTMALRSLDDFNSARRYYLLWLIPFSLMTLAVGLCARAIIPDITSQLGATGSALNAEQALPVLSLELLSPVLVGVILSGVFAATMSTADSQILTCSAAVTQDFLPRFKSHYWASKIATLSVAALALGIALSAGDGVFQMVLMAWSVLGASLGPLVILRILGRVPPPAVANFMMLVGTLTVFAWKLFAVGHIYELVPGMLAAFLVLLLSRLVVSPAGRWLD